jgi:hypothetical protein
MKLQLRQLAKEKKAIKNELLKSEEIISNKRRKRRL